MQLALTKAPTFAHSELCRPAKYSPPCAARSAAYHAAALIKAPTARLVARAAAPEASTQNGTSAKSEATVVVKIDNESDPFATVVTVEFGDYLGELVDTVAALKNLGLNIKRAKLKQAGTGGKHRFYVTDGATSEKVIRSSKIEEIRLTILNMMLAYHPESSEQIAWSTSAPPRSDVDPTHPLGARKRYGIQTQIEVREHESGSHSTLIVNTLDRPGLLTDIVKVLKDINLNVVSAEVDTIGRNAFDKFNVTYHGEALPEPMCQLCVNALQYYLSQAEVEKEWSESY